MGITCPRASARDMRVLLQRSPTPKQMAFSGAIWMLDLDHSVQPLDNMDFARTRWALEQMVAKQSVNMVLGKVVVRAESVPNEGGFKNLRKVERDEHIVAIVLAS